MLHTICNRYNILNNHLMRISQHQDCSPLSKLQRSTVTPSKPRPYNNISATLQSSYTCTSIPNNLDDMRYNQNAYLNSGSALKRPRTYCPLSRKQLQPQDMDQVIRKGSEYSNSKEYTQFKKKLMKLALTEEEIIVQMKSFRNNKVYLPQGPNYGNYYSQQEPNFKADKLFATKTKEPLKQEEVKVDAPSFSIDQLSKIQEKDTLCEEYRVGVSRYDSKVYSSGSSLERKELDKLNSKVKIGLKQWKHPIKIQQQSCQQASQQIIIPKARQSPLHFKPANQNTKTYQIKYKQISNPLNIREENKLRDSLSKEKVNCDRYNKKHQKCKENAWSPLKDKENINYQAKSNKVTNKIKCNITSQILEGTFYLCNRQKTIKQTSPKRDIYNIDFKVARPALDTFSSQKSLAFQGSSHKKINYQHSQQRFTPLKPTEQDHCQRTKRYLNHSKEHSDRSNRSVSKGKLSVVSASRRHH